MRVLFDHQVFSWQSYGGISRYFVEVAKGLLDSGHLPAFPEYFYTENVYLRTIPGIKAGSLTPFSFKGKKWLQERLGRGASLKALKTLKPDVFHPTYFGDYYIDTILKFKTPFVITIHDMIHEKYAHGSRGVFSLDANVVANKRRLAQLANAVVVVSENTRKDVLAYIPDIDPAKIHVIYHGNSMRAPDPNTLQNSSFPARYLLFVGQRGTYKNFSWMLEQLAAILREDASLHLVCAGGTAFDQEEMAQMARLGITDKVLHPAIHSDSDLAKLYAQAQCFIFPSQYEGFGMPVVEAFSCGCPCVLNKTSSLPEVGGEAALYFQEEEEGSFIRAVTMLLYDQEIRDTQIKKGYEQAKLFTWEQSVAAHLTVYNKIV